MILLPCIQSSIEITKDIIALLNNLYNNLYSHIRQKEYDNDSLNTFAIKFKNLGILFRISSMNKESLESLKLSIEICKKTHNTNVHLEALEQIGYLALLMEYHSLDYKHKNSVTIFSSCVNAYLKEFQKSRNNETLKKLSVALKSLAIAYNNHNQYELQYELQYEHTHDNYKKAINAIKKSAFISSYVEGSTQIKTHVMMSYIIKHNHIKDRAQVTPLDNDTSKLDSLVKAIEQCNHNTDDLHVNLTTLGRTEDLDSDSDITT